MQAEGGFMAQINVSNLTFGYEGSYDNIFENVSFSIDTNWKLGFIGRNGKGKTTFLNLLLGKYEYQGSITKTAVFDYFPYRVNDAKDLDKTADVPNRHPCGLQAADDLEQAVVSIGKAADAPLGALHIRQQPLLVIISQRRGGNPQALRHLPNGIHCHG